MHLYPGARADVAVRCTGEGSATLTASGSSLIGGGGGGGGGGGRRHLRGNPGDRRRHGHHGRRELLQGGGPRPPGGGDRPPTNGGDEDEDEDEDEGEEQGDDDAVTFSDGAYSGVALTVSVAAPTSPTPGDGSRDLATFAARRPCYIPDLTDVASSEIDATVTLRVNRLEYTGEHDYLAANPGLTTGSKVTPTPIP